MRMSEFAFLSGGSLPRLSQVVSERGVSAGVQHPELVSPLRSRSSSCWQRTSRMRAGVGHSARSTFSMRTVLLSSYWFSPRSRAGHPCTQALVAAMPLTDPAAQAQRRRQRNNSHETHLAPGGISPRRPGHPGICRPGSSGCGAGGSLRLCQLVASGCRRRIRLLRGGGRFRPTGGSGVCRRRRWQPCGAGW